MSFPTHTQYWTWNSSTYICQIPCLNRHAHINVLLLSAQPMALFSVAIFGHSLSQLQLSSSVTDTGHHEHRYALLPLLSTNLAIMCCFLTFVDMAQVTAS